MKEVKYAAIKTENDIQKLRVPEIRRLMSVEDNIQTPKSYNNPPLPKNTIKLGDIATKYLPKINDKCFRLYYNDEWEDH